MLSPRHGTETSDLNELQVQRLPGAARSTQQCGITGSAAVQGAAQQTPAVPEGQSILLVTSSSSRSARRSPILYGVGSSFPRAGQTAARFTSHWIQPIRSLGFTQLNLVF